MDIHEESKAIQTLYNWNGLIALAAIGISLMSLIIAILA